MNPVASTKPAGTGGAAVDRLSAAILCVLVGFVASLLVIWLADAPRGVTWLPDLAAFYTAWAMVLDGHGARIYDLALQARYQEAIPELAKYHGSLLGYYNPPFVAALLAPLALLSLTNAFWVWTVGQVLVGAGLFRGLRLIADSWRRPELAFLFGATLAYLPFFMTFYKGALSLAVLVGLVWAYQCLGQGQDRKAGVWLALALAKPQFLVLVVVALLAARRWATLATLGAAAAALAVISAVILSPHIWLDYADLLARSTGFYDLYGVVPHVMYNLRGALVIALGPEQAGLIGLISSAALVAAAVLIAVAWSGAGLAESRPEGRATLSAPGPPFTAVWRPGDATFDLRFAFTVCLGFLLSPHAYQYDAVVLILPGLLFHNHLRRAGGGVLAYRAFVLTSIGVFSLVSITGGGPFGVLPPIAVTTVFAGWMGFELIRSAHRRQPPRA